jgi:nicotinamidase-related amidase
VLIDYQPNILDLVFEQDRRLVEHNARALATAAVAFKIPVILTTVGVEMGVNEPTIPSLKDLLAGVEEIDRSQMNAWEDRAFVDAVKATGRKRLVMCGIVTSVCLAYPAVDALGAGYEVMFVEDAVADQYKDAHDMAVLRLVQAGAVPNNTTAMITEWFRDWKSPLADSARKFIVPYLEQVAAFRRAPEYQKPKAPAARPVKTATTGLHSQTR